MTHDIFCTGVCLNMVFISLRNGASRYKNLFKILTTPLCNELHRLQLPQHSLGMSRSTANCVHICSRLGFLDGQNDLIVTIA